MSESLNDDIDYTTQTSRRRYCVYFVGAIVAVFHAGKRLTDQNRSQRTLEPQTILDPECNTQRQLQSMLTTVTQELGVGNASDDLMDP